MVDVFKTSLNSELILHKDGRVIPLIYESYIDDNFIGDIVTFTFNHNDDIQFTKEYKQYIKELNLISDEP